MLIGFFRALTFIFDLLTLALILSYLAVVCDLHL
jgi:hypothetical protein